MRPRSGNVGGVRFGVLGQLEVRTERDEPVRVPELKVRLLLGHLLLRSGEPVPVDRLIEELWGARPPADPKGAVQAKVSQLRRVLDDAEPGGRDLVVFDAAGYRLRVPGTAVDAGRFLELVERARAEGDARARAALLDDALNLWRGPAFADLGDALTAQPVVARLHDQRIAAVEERAETLLALGEHVLLADELAEVAARHPLRERMRAAQMRALYRSGRGHEALVVFEELRTGLRDELGADPSPELVELHREMLRHSPSLRSAPVPSAGYRPPPLPAPLTRLIGRDEDVERVVARLAGARLVTLTGFGGVGKTRLALAAAARWAERLSDGVRFAELAGLGAGESVAAVAGVIGTALGAKAGTSVGAGAGSADALAQLISVIGDVRGLLVLDNCEHLTGAAAEVAGRVLAAAPGLVVLATSREPLGLAGEALFPVAPLPPSGAALLFAERAADADPGFVLDEHTEPQVLAICESLDGIPLALELAAARLPGLGLGELTVRLCDRFRTLSAPRPGVPERQRTLWSMIDWSWSLLTEPEQVVLRRLSVFAGGCALEAAEEVCAERSRASVESPCAEGNAIAAEGDSTAAKREGVPASGGDGGVSGSGPSVRGPEGFGHEGGARVGGGAESGAGIAVADVAGVMARLVDRSLLVRADGDRYRLLESVREYAGKRLAEAGEDERFGERHAEYFLGFAECAEPGLRGREQGTWLRALDAEEANMQAALARSPVDRRLRLVDALAWYWFLRGRPGVALDAADAALALPGGDDDVRAGVTVWRTGLALWSRPGAAVEDEGQAALDLLGPDNPRRARAHWFLSFARWGFGDMGVATRWAEVALAACRAAGDEWGCAAALSTLASYASLRDDIATARRDARRAEELFAALGDRWGRLQALDTLAGTSEILGDYAEAIRLQSTGLRIAEDLSFDPEIAGRLSALGRVIMLTGDLDTAYAHHERARALAVNQGNAGLIGYAEFGMALVARRRGDLTTAERLLTPWVTGERASDTFAALTPLAELGFIAELRGDGATALGLHEQGYRMALATGGGPRALALALEGMAGAKTLLGDPDSAARLLGAADAARRSVGAPLPSAERFDVDRITGAARKSLGADGFDAAFAEGATSPPRVGEADRPRQGAAPR